MLRSTICPWCGGQLLPRVNSQTHQSFVGCSGYPKCRYTRKYIEEVAQFSKDDLANAYELDQILGLGCMDDGD
jgi:ssDNA-binding Zn-finger/Zn-ribbon topoisomerase 1